MLLRLTPGYEALTIEALQDLVASSWKKRDARTDGITRLATGGFRKQHQPALYQRLARAVSAYLADVDARLDHHPHAVIPTTPAHAQDIWDALRQRLASVRVAAAQAPLYAEIQRLADQLDTALALMVTDTDAAEALAAATLAYARELHDDGRDSALVAFRSNISETLHILGQHAARGELGALAIDAATVLDNPLAQAEILVDDLGWGSYMQGEVVTAVENISTAQTTAERALTESSERSLDLSLVAARAIRHRAIIQAQEHTVDTTDDLLTAQSLLADLDPANEIVRREVAQVAHARALISAIIYGVGEDGSLPASHDPNSTFPALRAVIPDVEAAAAAFRALGDQARYTKALFLHVRLLQATGQRVQARQARAVRDRALASSEWSRPDRVTTLDRV